MKRSMSSGTGQPWSAGELEPQAADGVDAGGVEAGPPGEALLDEAQLLLEAGRHLLRGQRGEIAGQEAVSPLEQVRPRHRPSTPRPCGPDQSATSAAWAAASRRRSSGRTRRMTGTSQRAVRARPPSGTIAV